MFPARWLSLTVMMSAGSEWVGPKHRGETAVEHFGSFRVLGAAALPRQAAVII